jgi:hypothetical protein
MNIFVNTEMGPTRSVYDDDDDYDDYDDDGGGGGGGSGGEMLWKREHCVIWFS